ncbi:MAG: hypothetical protein IPH89_13470 [Bacteroidetes bacterium]|nr:hypothetical protein [Bacteroidota bacterium]
MQAIQVKRPVLITIVSIIGFIWVIISLPGVFAPEVKKIGDWMPAIFGIIRASMFISLIGVWYMKRWGVRLFIMVFFFKEIVFLLINDTNFLGIFLSIFFIISMLVYYKRMDPNL